MQQSDVSRLQQFNWVQLIWQVTNVRIKKRICNYAVIGCIQQSMEPKYLWNDIWIKEQGRWTQTKPSELEYKYEYDAEDEENIVHMKRVKNKHRKVFMVIWHLRSKTKLLKMHRKQTQAEINVVSYGCFCEGVFICRFFFPLLYVLDWHKYLMQKWSEDCFNKHTHFYFRHKKDLFREQSGSWL